MGQLTLEEIIKSIKIDRANLEYIAVSGKINGSLFLSINKSMQEYADQQIQQLNDRLKEREAEIVLKEDKINDLIKACNDYSDEVNQLQSTIQKQDALSEKYDKMYSDLLAKKEVYKLKLSESENTISDQQEMIRELIKTQQETQKDLDDTFHQLEGSAEHIKQLQSRISELENKWISVDMLPKAKMGWSENEYIVLTKYGYCIGRTRDNIWVDMTNMSIKDVTHYQPLPQYPESLTKKQD